MLIRDFLEENIEHFMGFCNRDGRDGEGIVDEIFLILSVLGGYE